MKIVARTTIGLAAATCLLVAVAAADPADGTRPAEPGLYPVLPAPIRRPELESEARPGPRARDPIPRVPLGYEGAEHDDGVHHGYDGHHSWHR